MIRDLLAVVGASAVLAVGVWGWWWMCRKDRKAPPRPSQLQRRQWQREVDESRPISWRR